ncbi:FAD:protein FMN transferase [Aeromicrobium endophyticum]|uniref:FAD:protein FMN transferase n=1 Tax=Aeromicrobium endophyticum TaxID=2292704 RepID=A0A371P9L1_9ACTN|nr:FAD:protein FMN transferase [Aeromicrobium endophyticum]REK72654.1 FAD:protein FMN transferase [Aeromicrobium endophyticum]
MHAWGFEAIGTAWQIDTPEPLASDVRAAVLDRIDAFDQVWSRFRPDSLVSQIASEDGPWAMPAEADRLLGLYAALADATDGAVNPLVGRTLSDLGYDAAYSLVAADAPADVPPWSTLELVAGSLRTSEPVLIDVGAAGKGLLVDEVSRIVDRQTHQFTIDASGDLLHSGVAPLRIALEHPLDASRAIGIAEIAPGDALCASATNRRSWGDGLHHVVDARTGRPTDDVVATWVVADSCMLADGLATAHFFGDPALLMERFEHQFVRMHADGRVQWSPDFPGEIFT